MHPEHLFLSLVVDRNEIVSKRLDDLCSLTKLDGLVVDTHEHGLFRLDAHDASGPLNQYIYT